MTQPNPPSESELHYKELKSFFQSLVKYTLTALGIVLAAGAIFFFKNISEVKSEASAAIDAEKRLASSQLDSIRKDAAVLAVQEARRAVDEAFKSNNIVEMVNKAARLQAGAAIDRHVAQEVDQSMSSLQSDISALGTVADNAMKMRIGLRAGLEQLLKMQFESSSEKQRERARNFFESIAVDFDTVYSNSFSQAQLKDPKAARSFAQAPDTLSVPRTIGSLVRIIRTDRDLSQVATAFLYLRGLTGIQFRMFDIKAVEVWCTSHRVDCAN